MANVKELKIRIKSTKGTLKITQAMKLVSAAKLARAQSSILSSRPYASELDKTVRSVSSLIDNYSHPYLEENRTNKFSYLIVVSSNKGLCGSYNNQLFKTVKNFMKSKKDEQFKLLFIGKKGFQFFKSDFNTGELYGFSKLEPEYEEIEEIAKNLGEEFVKGEVGKVYIAYNLFKSALNYIPTISKLLPISFDEEEAVEASEGNEGEQLAFDYKYDPSAKVILDDVIPQSYLVNFYTCILDALASEHGSRMAAMDQATKSCQEMISLLTLKMNKLRQAAITTELIEVVSGAEALNA